MNVFSYISLKARDKHIFCYQHPASPFFHYTVSRSITSCSLNIAWTSLYFLTRSLSLYFARRTYDFSLNPPRCARNFRSERDLVGDLRTIESANSVLTRLSKAMLMHRDEPRHVRGRRRREPSRREMEVHIGCDEIALWHCGLHERREDAIGVGGCWMSCALLSGRHSIRIH